MAPTLGKRKRVTREEFERPSKSPSPSSDSEQSDNEDLQAILRRAFEAKFKPLDVEPKNPKIKKTEVEEKASESEEEEESEWSGISDDNDQIEVIDHTDSRQKEDQASKAEKRAFMSTKPPISTITRPSNPQNPTKQAPTTSQTETETTHLKNDLALQKLLRDSHLLSTSRSTSGTSTPTTLTNPNASSLSLTGPARHKSTDLHLQSLGAKSSIYTQKNMPMAQRKHMAEKARLKEGRRRAEAREAGIVLEKEKRERKDVGRRDRGVGGPSIGRFKGGTLMLSREDVRGITGGGGRGAKGKGKGKKGRR